MLGDTPPEPLPEVVKMSVQEVFTHAVASMGPIRMEWAFDGKEVWVVQLHRQPQPESERTG